MGRLTLRPNDTGIILVDVQEKLCAAMPERELSRAIRCWAALLEMAARFRLPVAVTEQYPKGLGRTLPLLREILGKTSPPPRFVDKLDFSACGVPLFDQLVLDAGRRTWLVAGMEAHICVFQTVRGLCERGLHVHVASDAVLSRKKSDYRIALGLMEDAGATITSTEVALFDLVGRGEGDHFVALQKLIK